MVVWDGATKSKTHSFAYWETEQTGYLHLQNILDRGRSINISRQLVEHGIKSLPFRRQFLFRQFFSPRSHSLAGRLQQKAAVFFPPPVFPIRLWPFAISLLSAYDG